MEITITSATAGQKLLKFLLKNFPAQPKAYWYKALRTGRVLLNGEKPKALNITLVENDKVLVRLPQWRAVSRKPYSLQLIAGPLDIVYEDEYFLVVDKPAGLAVHGGSKHVGDNLINRVKAYLKVPAESRVPAPINRLDLETSGLMLIGKTQASVTALGKIFSGRQVEKEYSALVHAKDFSFADGKIKKDMIEGKEGKETVESAFSQSPTEWGKVPRVSGVGGLHIVIHTGKTHQIRKQLQRYQAVIVGDPKYGDFALNKKLGAKRMCLHAERLAFIHPWTKKRVVFKCPPSFENLL